MQAVDYSNYDFGQRLDMFVHEIMNLGGCSRKESEITEGQKVFLRAIKRERIKYIDAQRQGYPTNQLEQLEAFVRTIGDLHNSYFDAGMPKVSDCLYNRWRVLFEETKRLTAAGGANKPCWVEVIEVEKSDMPAFFDA